MDDKEIIESINEDNQSRKIRAEDDGVDYTIDELKK